MDSQKWEITLYRPGGERALTRTWIATEAPFIASNNNISFTDSNTGFPVRIVPGDATVTISRTK